MKKFILVSLLVSALTPLSSFAQEETPATEETPASSMTEPTAPTESPTSPDSTAAAPTEKAEAAATESSAETKTVATASKPKVTSISSAAIGLSTIQWNEPLILKQAGKSETDVANYSGLAVSYQKETIYYHWGWNFGGFLGTGRANGGGNASTITYQKDKQAFTIIGVSPRAFWRLTGKVNVGITGMAYLRSVDWPTDTAGLTVDTTRNFTLTALADLNIRITDKIDFYQGLGPLDNGATFWKIGLAYRMP